MPHPPLRIAVLGLGMAVQPHGRSLVELQDEGRVEVLGCWSRSAERRAAFAERHGLPVTGDLDNLLARPELDAALLLTPPDAREDFVTRLAQAGKHILAEKPVQRTTAAAERIVAGLRGRRRHAWDRLPVPLSRILGGFAACSIRRRWARSWRSSSPSPGGACRATTTPRAVARWPRRRRCAAHPGHRQSRSDAEPDASGGGKVAAVAGTSRIHRMETEDSAAGGLVLTNGALGGLFATTAAYPGDPERLSIAGTKARATLASGTLEVRYLDGRTEQMGEPAATGGGADPMAFPHGWHKGVIRDFVDAVQAWLTSAYPLLAILQVYNLHPGDEHHRLQPAWMKNSNHHHDSHLSTSNNRYNATGLQPQRGIEAERPGSGERSGGPTGYTEWAVMFDADTTVMLDPVTEQQKLVLSIDLGRPAQESRLVTYETMLAYNVLWQETGGVKMGLGPAEPV